MPQQSASHLAIQAGWLVSNAMEQIVLSYWCNPKSSTSQIQYSMKLRLFSSSGPFSICLLYKQRSPE